MQIKTVLVPVDFSPQSTLAVNNGVALARKFRAKLTLLHVVEPPGAILYTLHLYTAPAQADQAELERMAQAEKKLPQLVSPEDQDDLDVSFIVRFGEAEHEIKNVASEEHADIVVMGTQGRGLLGQLFIGSVALGLLRTLHIPVFTVCHVSRPLDFKRILFATDFGPNSDKSLQIAFDMAAQTGATLIVAHTMDKRPSMTYETPEVHELFDEQRTEDLTHTHKMFDEFKAEATRRGMNLECILAEGDAPQTLVRIADETEADFIVLGLRKQGAVARALVGSVAEPVIRAAHVPVFSIPIDTMVFAEEGQKDRQHA
jgi:nucleotide-binding universal stress UspA family protein